MGKKKLLIIDANALIHRAFHALPSLTTKKGKLINAVYGFLLIFFKSIKDIKPDFIVATFDFPAPTFRHKKYKKYKAQRKKTPEELIQQIPIIKEVLKKFRVKVLEKKGFEADDLIGYIVKKASQKKVESVVVTGDLDLLQLVDKNVKVYGLRRGVKDIILYDKEKVKERYQGLKPSQLTNFKALRGDPSDNIPGVTGVGEKTAIELVKKFKTLENLYQQLEKDSERAKKLKPALKKNLKKYKKRAFLSKFLVELKYNIPLKINIKNLKWGDYDEKEVIEFFKDYDFQTLIPRLKEIKEKENNQLTII